MSAATDDVEERAIFCFDILFKAYIKEKKCPSPEESTWAQSRCAPVILSFPFLIYGRSMARLAAGRSSTSGRDGTALPHYIHDASLTADIGSDRGKIYWFSPVFRRGYSLLQVILRHRCAPVQGLTQSSNTLSDDSNTIFWRVRRLMPRLPSRRRRRRRSPPLDIIIDIVARRFRAKMPSTPARVSEP